MNLQQSSEVLVSIIEKLVKDLSRMKMKELANIGYEDLSLSLSKYVNAIVEMGSPTPSDIASYFEISKPAVTGNVDKLVKLGLVLKLPSEDDGRVIQIVPTAEGNKIALAFRNANSAFVEQMRVSLEPEEFETLIRLLNKI